MTTISESRFMHHPSSLPRRIGRTLSLALALASCSMLLLGCHASSSSEPPPGASTDSAESDVSAPTFDGASAKRMSVSAELAAPAAPAPDEAPAQRFIAVRQSLAVEVPSEQLANAWHSVRDLCASLQCEVLSASLSRETPQQQGSAMLELRVAPPDVDRLLGGLAGVAKVTAQQTSSEDKTAQVIDVEAQIRNRTEFRDGLRQMLSDTSVKRTLSDLLTIQRTLSQTQAEIDAAATRRKVLAQQTGKQHVQISFSTTRAIVSPGGHGYSPVANALRQAWDALAESVGTLITVVAMALPWLLLVVLPFAWGMRWLLRRGRGHRVAP